ncbi:MAG: HAMP domain-containing sensor histidine kinase [Luteolibacter sp.]
MLGFFKSLFDTSDFPARWDCGNWTLPHGSVHIGADLAIATAYAMIPLALARYYWVKRTELAFPKILWLFALFIFSCGSTHLVEAIIFYHPIYRISALLKVITAIASWATVVGIIRIAPLALELPGLRRVNGQLQELLLLNEETRAALERSNRDLEDFTRVVTHDLRNPISGTLLLAELAKESAQAGDHATTADDIEILADSLRQMSLFVTELHTETICRDKSAQFSIVSLNEVMDRVRNRFASLIKSSHAMIVCADLPSVVGNATMLEQLFSNLIDNAIKYRSDDDPVIHVRGDSDGTGVRVRVSDNGRGIPVQDRARVFEQAVRAGNSDGVVGSGLGLALCRKIMTDHMGTIELAGDSSMGTTFQLVFHHIEEIRTGSLLKSTTCSDVSPHGPTLPQ